VWAAPLGDARLDAAVRRAVEDWNALFVEALGREAFAWTPRREAAQVTVAVEAAVSANLMGETYVRTGDGGVIELPVRIVVYEPRARGQTSRETLLYGIVAHELGHALGLPHTRDPRSLMCCVPGSVDFQDPVARDAYVEARRRPEVASVRGQLIEQYQRFWRSGS
jgi:predicted Zn-dependent protease